MNIVIVYDRFLFLSLIMKMNWNIFHTLSLQLHLIVFRPNNSECLPSETLETDLIHYRFDNTAHH